MLAGVFWLRCYVHFLRNTLDYVPRKVDDDCLLELRWMYDRRDLAEVRRDLAGWLAKWGGVYPKLTGWVEENIEETLTCFRLPLAHRRHMKSTTCSNASTRRSGAAPMWRESSPMRSCLRLVRALTIERHEAWLEDHRYLNMDLLKEHKKEALRQTA